jgi:hypothetical protein
MGNFKVLLCVPPDYDWNLPPLGTAALTGFLKQKNDLEVEQVDLNIQYRDFLFDKSYFTHKVSPELKKRALRTLLSKYFSTQLNYTYYSSFLPCRDNFHFLKLPYENNTNSSFFFTERMLSSEILCRYINDETENTFLAFFKENDFVQSIARKNLDLIGLSITSPSQVIPSLTLANLVKKSCPGIHITAGGQWVSLFRKDLLRHNFFQDFFDSFIYFEGETPLGCLIDALEGKRDLDGVPNLIYRENLKFRNTGILTEEDLDTLPAPDFTGLPLFEYTANQGNDGLALTFETSRGCYWGRCAFCVDLPLPKLKYRRKNPSLVVRDIKELIAKHQVQELLFSDPALSAQQMQEISQGILQNGVTISWWTMARLDKEFDAEIFALAKNAGCKSISFGFESASDRVCEKLDKGNKRDKTLRVISDCHRSGIMVKLQVMLGLPGETFEDALETVAFLAENKEKISDVCFNEFYLTPGNHVFLTPKKYDIDFTPDPALPFKFFHEFKRINGLTSRQVEFLQGAYNYLSKREEYSQASVDISLPLCINSELKLSEAVITLNSKQAKIYYLTSDALENDFIVLNEMEQRILSLLNKRLLNSREIISLLSSTNSKGDIPEKEVLFSLNELFRFAILRVAQKATERPTDELSCYTAAKIR